MNRSGATIMTLLSIHSPLLKTRAPAEQIGQLYETQVYQSTHQARQIMTAKAHQQTAVKPGRAPDSDSIPLGNSHTPEEAAKIISFALSELSAENAHHDFEHLCRHIARRRIASNILPATGPVSSGGDAGADFETVPVYSGSENSDYWRLVASEKIIFACSLEKNLKKKIAADLAAASRFPEPVERLYFFYNKPIPVAHRNKFKAEALSKYGIRLEIIDSKAIAEFLANRELLWIGERYLSLPMDLHLPEDSSVPSWYRSLLHDPEIAQSMSFDTFYQLKSAIRHATAIPECHSDIPKFVEHLKRFRSHPRKTIARKAFYEEFVAMLRGLNAAEGYESQILDYLADVDQLTEPDEFEDVSNILGYASGARCRGILSIDLKKVEIAHENLFTRINARLPKHPSFIRCAFLFIRGFVELKDWYIHPSGDKSTEAFEASARKSVATWTILLKEAAEVQIFPIERLSDTVDFLFTYFNAEWFSDFVNKLDALIAERVGAERTAETRAIRGSALLEDEQYFRALDVFHQAFGLAQNAKSQSTAVTIGLQLAELYHFLGLHHAAKYYAQASAFASLSLSDDELKQYAAVGLAVACQADYANGASLSFFLTYHSFVMSALEFKIAGSKQFKEEKWGTVDYYAQLLTRASMLWGPNLHAKCLDSIQKAGLGEQYTASEALLNEFFAPFMGDPLRLAESYREQGIASPFSDSGEVRRTAWQQGGLEWFVSWSTDYEAERLGTAFCAVIQIVCASLHSSELTLAADRISVHLTVLSSGPAFRQLPNNDILEFSINLAYVNDLSLEEAMWAIFNILKEASAIPDDSFDAQLKGRFRGELVDRCGAYVSPAEAFRQFYGKETFEEIHSGDQEIVEVPTNLVQTRSDHAEGTHIHPAYDEADAIQLVKNRYKRIASLYPITLRQLSLSPSFHRVVSALRADGWKDWHVLQAIASIRVNDLAKRSTDWDRTSIEVFQNGEKEQDPITPEHFFDEASLRRALQMSQFSTMKGLGFKIKQITPNYSRVNKLLRRFRYWDLDIPHQDPFPDAVEEANNQ